TTLGFCSTRAAKKGLEWKNRRGACKNTPRSHRRSQARTSARGSGSVPRGGGGGWKASKDAVNAQDWGVTGPASSSKMGTAPKGLRCKKSDERCSPANRLTGCSGTVRPFSARYRRTLRQLGD